MDNCQWKEVVYAVVLASINLMECHRIAIPGDPMCGLHVVRKGHRHEAIYNFVEEAEKGHRSSLFKGFPVLIFGMSVPAELARDIHLQVHAAADSLQHLSMHHILRLESVPG